MKSINKILMKAKHEQYKERKQEHDLDLENQDALIHGKCLLL